MTWKERLIGLPLAIAGAALLSLTLAGMLLTRTDWGREKVRGYALEKLASAIRGRVEIDEVLEGDLLRQVSLAGVRFLEEDGREFASVDTLIIHYRWSDFLFGDLTFAKATIINPVVSLRSEPGIGWNFEEAFRGPRSDAPAADEQQTGSGLRLELQDVAIRSGDVTLLIPWDSAGADSDSVRWHLRDAYGELWREIRFERLNARLSVARVITPPDVSRLFQIVQLNVRATILDDPFEVQQLRADLEVIDNTLSFDVWEGDFPASSVFGQGWVTLESDPQYDFTLRGSPIATTDIEWLLPWMPAGSAELDFNMRTLSDGIALGARNARWQSPEARVRGGFDMSLRDRPDGLAFDTLDLDVETLNTSLITFLTGWESPVGADLSGHVALNGPLSNLSVDAGVTIEAETLPEPTRFTALGTVRASHVWRGELGADDLRLEFDTVRLDLVRALIPGIEVRGDLTGWAHLDGRLAEGVEIDFAVEQRDAGLSPIGLQGAGRVASDTSGLLLDVAVHAEPFSFNTLSRYYPVVLFRGDLVGDVRASGPLSALDVEATLTAVAGDSLRAEGTVEVDDGNVRYAGRVEGRKVRVAPFREGLSQSDIDFRVELVGSGTRWPDLEATGHLEVFSSFVGGVQLDTSFSDLRLAAGRLLIDSAWVVTEFGEMKLSGDLGLAPDSAGRLAFDIVADSVGGLTPWVYPGYSRLAGPSLLPTGEASGADVAAQLEGSAHIWGELVGTIRNPRLAAELEGGGLRLGAWSVDSLEVRDFEIAATEESLRLGGEVSGQGVSAGALRLESVAVTGAVHERSALLEFAVAADSLSSASGRLRVELGQDPWLFGVDRLDVQLGDASWRLEDAATVRLSSSGALAVDDAVVLSPVGTVNVGGVINDSGPASFHASATGIELGDLTALWPGAIDLSGVVTARADLSGRTRAPQISGSFEISDGSLLGIGFSSVSGQVGYQDRVASIDVSMWRGEARLFRMHGTYPLELTLPDFAIDVPEREIDLTIEGDSVPLNLATLIFGDEIAEPHGYARGRVSVGGTPGNLSLDGPATLIDGGFRVIYSGITYRGLQGQAYFRGQNVELQNLSLGAVPLRNGASGGRGEVNGSINLQDVRNPGFDLTISGAELPLYNQLDARFIVSGRAHLGGMYRAPIVNGDLSVVSGVLFMDEIGRQAEIINPYFEPIEGSFVLLDSLFGLPGAGLRPENPFLDNLTMAVGVDVQHDTWLRSAEANVEIAGRLNISRQPGSNEWRIDGTLQAPRGDYRLFNKRFEVSEGTIEFVGVPAMNPNLRIVALYNLRTQKKPIEIRLIIGGTLENMMLQLESDAQPPIPESDLLSYLMFGRPSYEITRSTPEERSLLSDVAADVPQAFLGQALGSLLVGETGVTYIDVSRVNYWGGATDSEYQQGVGTAYTATQVEVGWYLAPTVFVSVAQHLAGTVRPTVRLEWQLDENLTLRGVTQPRFGEAGRLIFEVPGADIQQSIGLFLFYGWSY
jgi:translocation and assembly module TamB